jgi:hypothetical protein
VVRYSDEDTLREILYSPEGPKSSFFPRELVLPRLTRFPENAGLARRGVDPRDIIRVSQEEYREWRRKGARSGLLSEVRNYRSSIDQTERMDIAVPATPVREAASRGDRAAQALLEISGHLRSQAPVPRRLADLRAVVELPADARRYILEDGRLPVVLAELPPDQLPAQRLFIIDGDASVPALFTSRLFEVWARATRSISFSWSSRFSLTGTFETLPIPLLFTVIPDLQNRLQLRVKNEASRVGRLIGALGRDAAFIRSGRLIRAEEGMLVGHPLLEQINEALLSSIELDVSASDFEILERLVTMNAERARP